LPAGPTMGDGAGQAGLTVPEGAVSQAPANAESDRRHGARRSPARLGYHSRLV
jgi:hypothetical protein